MCALTHSHVGSFVHWSGNGPPPSSASHPSGSPLPGLNAQYSLAVLHAEAPHENVPTVLAPSTAAPPSDELELPSPNEPSPFPASPSPDGPASVMDCGSIAPEHDTSANADPSASHVPRLMRMLVRRCIGRRDVRRALQKGHATSCALM